MIRVSNAVPVSFLKDSELRARFFNKAKKTKSCWLWTCGKDKDGYGKFQITNGRRFKPKQWHVRAHRLALAFKLGRWPSGLVLHACDTPACVNPKHLKNGTQLQNIQHRDRYGNHKAILTHKDVRFIRRVRMSARVLAARFGVKVSAIHQARSRYTWKNVN